MLVVLALIPVIALLVFIYLKDKNEKEPIGLLIGLFFAGMGTTIPASIAEVIIQSILERIFYSPVLLYIVFAIFFVGPIEEIGKYAVLKLITWNNKKFNYSYDAIVYSVFASLGFAAFENVGYSISNGLGTAILRMFTAVPGHACFAVFMGYFYSRAKYAKITGNKKAYTKNTVLSLIVPMLVHGFYDAIVLGAREGYEDAPVISGLAALLWIGYVIAMITVCFIIVIKSSKNDFCILTLPDNEQTIYKPQIIGGWTCSCGKTNNFNFCSQCGKPRPMDTKWTCPKCGTLSTFNFCGNCGCPRPAPVNQTPVQTPV